MKSREEFLNWYWDTVDNCQSKLTPSEIYDFFQSPRVEDGVSEPPDFTEKAKRISNRMDWEAIKLGLDQVYLMGQISQLKLKPKKPTPSGQEVREALEKWAFKPTEQDCDTCARCHAMVDVRGEWTDGDICHDCENEYFHEFGPERLLGLLGGSKEGKPHDE